MLTGKTIRNRLDGERGVDDLVGELAAEYYIPRDEIEADVVSLMKELLMRSIVVPPHNLQPV